jgi:hypothetical protein
VSIALAILGTRDIAVEGPLHDNRIKLTRLCIDSRCRFAQQKSRQVRLSNEENEKHESQSSVSDQRTAQIIVGPPEKAATTAGKQCWLIASL